MKRLVFFNFFSKQPVDGHLKGKDLDIYLNAGGYFCSFSLTNHSFISRATVKHLEHHRV